MIHQVSIFAFEFSKHCDISRRLKVFLLVFSASARLNEENTHESGLDDAVVVESEWIFTHDRNCMLLTSNQELFSCEKIIFQRPFAHLFQMALEIYRNKFYILRSFGR